MKTCCEGDCRQGRDCCERRSDSRPITAKEMADYMWATLNKVVEEHYPEDEREDAKVRILNGATLTQLQAENAALHKANDELTDRHWTDLRTIIRLEQTIDVVRLSRENATLRDALTEIHERIQQHPAYEELDEDGEITVGGDTAELSYLSRVARTALENKWDAAIDAARNLK